MLVSGRVGGGFRYFLMIQFKVGIFFQWGGRGGGLLKHQLFTF